MSATQEYGASIQGVSIRVTRLDASGNLLNAAGDSYTTSGFMRLSFTPEYEDGEELTEKGADGTIKVSYKAPSTLKRLSMELALTEPDVELSQLISGGLLLRKNAGTLAVPNRSSIGWASPADGDDPAGNGVAIETWTNVIIDGKKAASNPYYHWIFPYAKLRISGDRAVENGILATTFQGYCLGNVAFGAGLDSRWEFPVAAARPYAYARSPWAPTGRNGFYTWHGELTATVSNVVRAATLVTITTTLAHGLEVGDSVVVAATTATAVNGTFTIVATPSTTTFTYNTTASGTIASAADTGTVVCAANSRAVSDFNSQGSTSSFNVPGSQNYNADNATDFIIASTLDPVI
jgi:hypothetical protein